MSENIQIFIISALNMKELTKVSWGLKSIKLMIILTSRDRK